ncbi:dynein light chain roadblock isoform X1 [Rhipicephalus microplus]|uniref:dynein light chain roadblock isoform X1 n=1 Tax=Rhipicephalus microplus TaxID=6941 RepID=UPI003F6BB1BC
MCTFYGKQAATLRSALGAKHLRPLLISITCACFHASEVEDIFKKLKDQDGVVGVVVTTSEGAAIKTSFDNVTTMQYATLVTRLCEQARSTLRDLEPGNDLTFLRMRTKKHEIMISPDKNYFLVVVQNPSG